MSLDVSLKLEGVMVFIPESIFIREDGQNAQISREEWNQMYPDREPFALAARESDEVFSGNVTHNLTKMAEAAGIYQHLWRPKEIGIVLAKELIEPLENGLAYLQQHPDEMQLLNPKNGWGSYEGLVRFVESYLAACKQYPEAKVSVWG